MTQPVVRVEHLIKTYDSNGIQTRALRGIDLDIQPGEFTALAGESGSGKSTLLHIIGGLLSVTDGQVWVEDQKLNDLSADELAELRLNRIGFVFQAYNLIPILTATENTEFVMELQGIDEAQRHERAMGILNELEIGEYADRMPNKLSGGQQQRVAVARAVAAEPALVLADEPTANLDSKNSENLIELMRNLNRSRGTTFVFASHDAVILNNVDRVIELRDGKVISDTRP
jgi:putative ABC transport system ATP-binding protein